MIKQIVELLKIADFKDESYNIQVAKGLYKYEPTIRKIRNQQERMKILKDRLKKNEV